MSEAERISHCRTYSIHAEHRKGSLYHFFPEGKNELVVAAVEQMSNCALAHVQSCQSSEDSVADAVHKQVSDLAKLVESQGQPIAIPFSAIAAITGDDNEEVTLACQRALQRLESAFLQELKKDGLKPSKARSVATFVISSIEGAFLISRTRRSGQPLRQAASNLRDFIANQIAMQHRWHDIRLTINEKLNLTISAQSNKPNHKKAS